ncbi:hypothetical protein Scep_011226 [Stephania cephalantha]|uniref:Uncharacterized protein n=1 Tax=Stephania cephalantha TaxID=152367 RepID=A0AAP0JCY0_9MAGN
MHVKNMSAASTSGNLVGFLTCTLRRIIMELRKARLEYNQLVGVLWKQSRRPKIWS